MQIGTKKSYKVLVSRAALSRVQGKIIGVPLYDLLKKKRDIRKNTKIGYVERFFLTWYILRYIFCIYYKRKEGNRYDDCKGF